MALEDQTTIDMISKPDAEGKICLVITDAGVTTDPDVRFELLTNKLQAYASAVLNGDLAMDYPDKQPSDFFIRVVCANPPTEAMKNISSVGQSENPMPVVFETWNPANTDAADETPPAAVATAPEQTPKRYSFPWRMALVIAISIVAIAGYFGYQLYRSRSFSSASQSLQTNAPKISGAKVFDMTIISAGFGMGKQIANVKPRLSHLLRTQRDGFTANAKTLFTDPLPGKKEQLTIRYNYKGANYTFTIPAEEEMSYQSLVNYALTNAPVASP